MNESEQVSQLIGDIYDATLDRGLWPSVLEKTLSYVQGMNCTLMVQDSALGTVPLFVQRGMDPHYEKLYVDAYARLSPVDVPTVLYAKVGDVLSVSDVVQYEEFLASRFYTEWAAPQGIVDAVSATLDKSATSYTLVVVIRHQRNGVVDEQTKQRMRLLAPHFRRAVNIGKLIDLYKVEAAALADTLDGLATAMFLVDDAAHIVHANVRGHAMLSEGSVVQSSAQLATHRPEANQALHDAFAAASHGDNAVGIKGISVPLTSSDSERFVAHVLPLTSGARRRGGTTYSAVAAVFVRKAALDLPHPLEAIAAAFKLTSGEMRVLMMIVQLGSVPEVAPVLGISQSTVKTHLQQIFDKTGTKRQSDLVKLVAGYMTPLS